MEKTDIDEKENTGRLLLGLVLNGDGDLLRLSEGISNDVNYFYNTKGDRQ